MFPLESVVVLNTVLSAAALARDMGSRDSPPIIMNFGLLGGLADVMNSSNYWIDRLRGFCAVSC
jgi:hypothetical protein